MDEEVSLTLVFRERGNGLSAKDVVSTLDNVLKWLAVAEQSTLDHASKTNWIVRDAHHSELTVVMAAPSPSDAASRAVRHVYNTVKELADLTRPPLFEPDEEAILRDLSTLSPRLDIALRVNDGGEAVPVISAAATRLPETVRTESKGWGTVEGTLETATVHHRRECSVWDSASAHRVTVSFGAELLDTVRMLFGHRVRVRGRIDYRGSYPAHIFADSLELAPERSDVPLASLFGIGRNWYEDLPAGELTRRLWGGDD